MNVKRLDQELRVNASISLKELPALGYNLTGYGQLYVKSSDGKIYFKRSGSLGETSFQPESVILTGMAAVTPVNSGVSVYLNGAWTNMSGSALRTAIGLGTTDSASFASVNVSGNLNVLGTTTTVSVQNLDVTNNMIVLNTNQTGQGITLGYSGIEIERGDLVNYRLTFVESEQAFMAGAIGQQQAIATRDLSANMKAYGIPYWDPTANMLKTRSTFYYNLSTGTLYAGGSVSGNSYSIGNTTVINANAELININVSASAAAIGNFLTYSGGKVVNRTSAQVISDLNLLTANAITGYYNLSTNSSDDVTQGTTHLFRSGNTTNAFLADYRININDYATTANLPSYTGANGITKSNGNQFTLGGNVTLPVTFTVTDTASISMNATGTTFNLSKDGTVLTGVFKRTDARTITLDGEFTHKKYVDDAIATALSNVSVNRYSGVKTNSNAVISAADPASYIKFVEGYGIGLAQSIEGAAGAVITISQSNVEFNGTLTAAATSSVNVVGKVGSVIKSVIIDYVISQGNSFQEGTIRALWNSSANAYQYTHEMQKTGNLGITIGGVTRVSDNTLSVSLVNSGISGTIDLMARGVGF